MFTLKSQQSDYAREENCTMWENQYLKSSDGSNRSPREHRFLSKTCVSHVCRGLMAAALLLSWSCSTRAPVTTTKPPAAGLQEKLDELQENSAKSPIPPKTIAFAEDEVNVFLAAYLKDKIPQAIGEPHVTILSDSQIAAKVIVDVDEIKRTRKRNSGALNFFSGKTPVMLRGDLTTRDGQGRFNLRYAEVNGLTLPKSLVLELLTSHTRTRQNPQGFDLEKPFDLPLKIRELILRPGELLVVQ
jgi:hypothetical protein